MTPEILPLKKAAEVWAQSGPDMWLYRWSELDGLAHLQGKGPRCAMTAAEYWEYERQRGAPQISAAAAQHFGILEPGQMFRVMPVEDDLQRIYASLETSLTEVTGLITSAQQALSVEDYGDGLAGALRRLELCVRCVRDLQGMPDNELEAVREWHRAESEACITELLHGVPDQGGNVNRYYLSQLIKMAFLSGAVEQLTRPFVRQPKTGGSDAA